MRTIALAVAALISLPEVAHAQASVDIRIDLPVVLPRLVVVSSGVQVVPDVDEEVFFVDGFYWVRRPGGWYRSRSHRGGWVVMPARAVPARIVKVPPGKYRRYKPQPAAHHRGDRDRGDRHRGHDTRYDRGHDKGRGHGPDKGHGKHWKH